MRKIRVYNDEEINLLLNNSNVERIKNKSQIVYKNDFKLWAVKQKISNPEMTAREIFTLGGFDMNIIDEQTPQKRINTWIKKYKMFGDEYFNDNNKFSYKAIIKDKPISNETNMSDSNSEIDNINNQDVYTFFIENDNDDLIKIVRLKGGKHGKTDCKI